MSQKPTSAPDVMRGVAGGVLLGTPLFYTQEVWHHGGSLPAWTVLAWVGLAFALDIALAYYVGFQRGRTHRPFEDAFVGLGLSILLSASLLWLLGRIGSHVPLSNIIGMVGLAAAPVSVGFAIGNALAPREGGKGAKEMKGAPADLLVAAAGALVFALNIAPTEEPVLLAAELGWTRLGALVAASLALPYVIVFYAEFEGRSERVASDGATEGPFVETLLAYVVAFAVSAALLAAVRSIDGVDAAALATVVTLAFPASLGAALGRVLV